ncbi:MAG: hypothetical protein K6T34_05405 [Thermoflavifilum sp.]|nr:hypothetical protein [Thermoflavifilum sp.]
MWIYLLFAVAPLWSKAQLAQVPNFYIQKAKQGLQLQWSIPQDFPKYSRIGVQRSADSLYNFSTIGYAPESHSRQMQFIDRQPLPDSAYYKLIFIRPNGDYFFSQTLLFVYNKTVSSTQNPMYASSATSVVNQQSPTTLSTNNYAKQQSQAYHPSIYVFTNPSGNITLSFPQVNKHAYHLVFFDSSGTKILEIPKIEESPLTLDKSNFLHAGWFEYELYDGNTLMEKWKLYVPDDVQVDTIHDQPAVRKAKSRPRHRRR